MNITRDIHSPANIDPAAYDYEGQIYQGPIENVYPFGALLGGADVEALKAIIDEITNRPLMNKVREAAREGGYSGKWIGTSRCDHCGHAHFHYGDVYRHRASGQYIVVGWQCSNDVFSFDSRRQLDQRNAKRSLAGIRKRGKMAAAAAAVLASNPGLEDALKLADSGDGNEQSILGDLRAKLVQWGNLSEKQIAFAIRLGDQVRTGDTAEVRKARKAAERAEQLKDVAPWTEGRQTVQGEVLTVRFDDGFYPAWKWLVQQLDGKRVWGTVPTPVLDAIIEMTVPGTVEGTTRHCEAQDLKGRQVKFDAAVQPKDDDGHFAFYKRPTKAVLV